MKEIFGGGEGVMGFHVNPQNLLDTNMHHDKIKSEMKFYINAGYDTYKFARLFQIKCLEREINYYYKVVNPEKGEQKRADKLCVYTDLENAETFLQLMKEVREENPDIHYRKPPLLAGTIQDFIGVGTDNISKSRESYNYTMAKICFSTMETVFAGIPKDKIVDTVRERPDMLQRVKDMIIIQASEKGLSEEKICVSKDMFKKNLFTEQEVGKTGTTISTTKKQEADKRVQDDGKEQQEKDCNNIDLS